MAFPPARLPRIVLQRVEQVPAVREIMNLMDLLQCERRSSSKTHITSTINENEVTGTGAETVSHITAEQNQEPMTIPEIRTEPTEGVDLKEEGFIAVNEEADTSIKQEEIPEDIIFPDIKSEPNEHGFSAHSARFAY